MYFFEDIYAGKLNRKIAGIALLSGALFLAVLILTDSGSHLGPGSPQNDLPNPFVIAAIIIATIGMVLFLVARSEVLAKTTS